MTKSAVATKVRTSTSRKAKKPEPQPDAIVFIPRQIRVGVILENHGRLDYGSKWIITRIVTDRLDRKTWTYHTVPATVAKHLRDTIYFRKVGGKHQKDIRQGSLGYLTYSSIWQLAKKG